MSRGHTARKAAERRGRWAEMLAILLLRVRFYRILATRWRCPAGEIDIVAAKDGVLVFVEVKARSSHEAGVNAVTNAARRRIEAAAEAFIRARRVNPVPPCRYDLIIVRNLSLHHHKNAWRSGDLC